MPAPFLTTIIAHLLVVDKTVRSSAALPLCASCGQNLQLIGNPNNWLPAAGNLLAGNSHH